MTVPNFGESVAPDHYRLDSTDVETIYVIGDVHGCIDELRSLWGKLAPKSDHMVVFVGDLVRKGPASEAVVEFVRRRDNAISVRGNNEEMIVRGEETGGLSPASLETIESFPLVVSWGDTMVVHGGVDPDVPFENHSPSDLLEMRSIPAKNGYDGPFWFEFYQGPPRIIFGHTVLTDPLLWQWTVGIDTGCVHGGRLTAYDCTRRETVSVPAESTYVPRSNERVV